MRPGVSNANHAEGGGEIGGFGRYVSRRAAVTDSGDPARWAADLGTNNPIFDRARCLEGGAPFDANLNESDGEHSLLPRRLAPRERRFVFAARAGVVEWFRRAG